MEEIELGEFYDIVMQDDGIFVLTKVQTTNNAETSDDLGQLETDVKVEGLIGEESDGTPPSTFHVNDSNSPMTQGSQSSQSSSMETEVEPKNDFNFTDSVRPSFCP